MPAEGPLVSFALDLDWPMAATKLGLPLLATATLDSEATLKLKDRKGK